MRQPIDFTETQQIAKNILNEFADFCREHRLRYYLAYGTLLGAARHGDIIPWDYDIDVMMPRCDLERFLRLTKKSGIGEHLTVLSRVTKRDYALTFAKVCDKRTRIVYKKSVNWVSAGIWIDIFPLDGFSGSEAYANELRDQRLIFASRALAITALPPKKNLRLLLIHHIMITLYRFTGRSRRNLKKIDALISKTPFDDADTVIVFAKRIYFIFQKSWFEDCITLPFGESEYAAPREYDRILRMVYQDYMKLPPEEEQKPQAMEAYWI
ncbi:MAG: LicD family protein [Oscillospiraceae bacterium]|nr:LicD family protein [Oscillospiraceae bacterium]